MKIMLIKNEKRTAQIGFLAVFLGLIRSLFEPFRLQYYASSPLSFEQIKPYLVGCLIAALGLLLMTGFFFYNRYRFILVIAALTILAMIFVKINYAI
jgi:hypothetical protein